ncbi:NAD-dependent epimerase/dehydratase family protein [Candidatus Parvarchaeota archaeon]|nr:NAD-dependent epimerase/dehydratase family protein [Candidatus Parvarchaeota archaeon]
MKNKNVLVTGGAGFIGSNTVEKLIDDNSVTVIDNLSNVPDDRFIARFKKNMGFRFLKRDITDPLTFSDLEDFDVVIHLAAHSDVRGGYEDPDIDFKQNIIGTKNVLDFIKRKGIKELIFSSSSAAYGEAKSCPTPEDYGPCIPISTYGATKLACEGLISAYSAYYGINASIYRFANVVGKNSTHGVIIDFINRLRKDKKKLEILGDGNQEKSYIYVSDCVGSMLSIHERTKGVRIVNLGNHSTTSVKAIASIVESEMGLHDVKHVFIGEKDGRGWKGDVRKMQLDIRKMEEEGWKNDYSSDDAVRKAVKDILSQ